MIPATWVTELHNRIAKHWEGECSPDDADKWLAVLSDAWVEKQRAGVMIKIGLRACQESCPHPPTVADFVAEAASAAEEPWAEALLASLPERQQSDNPLGEALESIARHAKSETAQTELAKMRQILNGEPVEQATGMTLAGHLRRMTVL